MAGPVDPTVLSGLESGDRLATRAILQLAIGVSPRANAVAPGLIVTPRTIPLSRHARDRRNCYAPIPMGRLGFPEEIASAILFLLSPAAAYVNGVLLPVESAWAHA